MTSFPRHFHVVLDVASCFLNPSIGDDIASNKKICFLRRSPMRISLYCYLRTIWRTKRRENRGLLRLLNTQRRIISISWSLYESFQQFITRKVKTFTTKEKKLLEEYFRINTTTQEVERRYKTIRTSFTRYLAKRRRKSGLGYRISVLLILSMST